MAGCTPATQLLRTTAFMTRGSLFENRSVSLRAAKGPIKQKNCLFCLARGGLGSKARTDDDEDQHLPQARPRVAVARKLAVRRRG